MDQKPKVDIESRLLDDTGVDAALQASAHDARQQHIRAGLSAFASRAGRVVEFDPTTLKALDEAKRDSAG